MRINFSSTNALVFTKVDFSIEVSSTQLNSIVYAISNQHEINSAYLNSSFNSSLIALLPGVNSVQIKASLSNNYLDDSDVRLFLF